MKFSKSFLLMFLLSFAFVGIAQEEPATTENVEITAETSDVEVVPTTAEETAAEIIEDVTEETGFDLPGKIIDLATSLGWWDFLNVMLFTLLGYLSPFIPGLRKIGDTEVRVVVGGITLIMIFVAMDFSSALKLALEFFAATKLYEHVLSMIVKTPKPAVEPTILKA